jgi:DNA helicase II / ATP-dependent DNA helicase PcrA
MIKDYEAIVTNFNSPILVLSGPGSGKTYMLADRTKRLLDLGTTKDSISIIAFGKDAVSHMYHELTKKTGPFKIKATELPHISTMHSLGLQIVKSKPRYFHLHKNEIFVLSDDTAKNLLYRDSALICGLEEGESKTSILCKQCGDCRKNEENAKCVICIKYWEIMAKCNYVDFDDQILFACELLENDSKILHSFRQQTKHLLIDEYQDINSAQHRLIKILSKASLNGLFAVGDDAQSIYGFRGSDPKFILQFEHDFPGAKIGSMGTSRRCPEEIITDAYKIIHKYYPNWKGKEYSKYIPKKTNPPFIWQFRSEIGEAKRVASIAKKAIPEKSVLILAPKKEFFPLISEHLTSAGVPHEIPDALIPERYKKAARFFKWINDTENNFLTRLIIEDLINTGIAKVPGSNKNRRLTASTIRNRNEIEKEIAVLWDFVGGENSLYSVLENYTDNNPTLIKIRDSLAEIKEIYENDGKNNLGQFMKLFFEITGYWPSSEKFMDEFTSIVSILSAQKSSGPGLVELKTMRKAKGLQSDVVIIVGLEDDIIPNPSGQLAEEARLFYVSMTRATEFLYLFHSMRRPRNITYGDEMLNKKRSIFLDIIGRKSEVKG